MWCPKHDSKTLVRNRDRTNTTLTNKKYCEFGSEKHKICLEKSSKFTLSTKSTNGKTKKQKSLYQNYEHLEMIRLVLQNINNNKKMFDQEPKEIENLETNTESINQNHCQKYGETRAAE